MVPCEVETPAAHGKLGQIWPGRHEGKEEKRAGGRRAEIRALLRPRDPAAGPPTVWGLALTPPGGAGHPPASRGKRAGGEHPSVLPPPSPGCGASPWPPNDLGGTGKTHPCPPPPRREPSPVSVPALPSVCPRVRGSGHAAGCPWGWVGTRRVPLQPRSVLTPRGFLGGIQRVLGIACAPWHSRSRCGRWWHGRIVVGMGGSHPVPQPLRGALELHRAQKGCRGSVPPLGSPATFLPPVVSIASILPLIDGRCRAAGGGAGRRGGGGEEWLFAEP